MPLALLDTNVISDLMTSHSTVVSRLRTYPEKVLTSAIVVGEIDYGLARLPVGKKRTRLEIQANQLLSTLDVVVVDRDIARTYGDFAARLERSGLTVDKNDLWIACTALTHGYRLVSRDRIFQQIPGLHVEDWSV